jgi:hypothetical protein
MQTLGFLVTTFILRLVCVRTAAAMTTAPLSLGGRTMDVGAIVKFFLLITSVVTPGIESRSNTLHAHFPFMAQSPS